MGVTKETLQQGDGTTFPQKGQTCTMHYTGTLQSDGSKFDSSRDRNKPFVFKVRPHRTGAELISSSTLYSMRPAVVWRSSCAHPQLTSCARACAMLLQIGVGQVIQGWEEGVAQMSKGERCKLTCTPDYAYGARGHPPVIPPNSTLIFDVELLEIQ